MYNEDLLKKLLVDFGESQTIQYCKMEAARNAYLFEECLKNKTNEECKEYDFERDWWHETYEKLNNNLKSS